jgi:hypothetical protein
MASNTSRVILTAIAAATLSLGLIGCAPSDDNEPSGSSNGDNSSEQSEQPSEALEEYAAAERAQIPAILEANPGIYSDVEIEAEAPHTIVFSYIYAEQVDPAAATEYFETVVPEIETLCETQLFPAMEAAGVEGTQAARYVYVNADGSVLWEKDFVSA